MSAQGTLDPDNPAERVTFRTPKGLLEELDEAIDDGLYSNRSEAIRSAIRSEFVDDASGRRNRGEGW